MKRSGSGMGRRITTVMMILVVAEIATMIDSARSLQAGVRRDLHPRPSVVIVIRSCSVLKRIASL